MCLSVHTAIPVKSGRAALSLKVFSVRRRADSAERSFDHMPVEEIILWVLDPPGIRSFS